MLSEIISKASVHLVGTLIIGVFVIPAVVLTFNFSNKIEKTLIKRNTPKWVINILTSFLVIGSLFISGFLGAMTVDYLGLEMIDLLYPVKKFLFNLF